MHTAKTFHALVGRLVPADDAFLLGPIAAEKGTAEAEFTLHRAKRVEPGHEA